MEIKGYKLRLQGELLVPDVSDYYDQGFLSLCFQSVLEARHALEGDFAESDEVDNFVVTHLGQVLFFGLAPSTKLLSQVADEPLSVKYSLANIRLRHQRFQACLNFAKAALFLHGVAKPNHHRPEYSEGKKRDLARTGMYCYRQAALTFPPSQETDILLWMDLAKHFPDHSQVINQAAIILGFKEQLPTGLLGPPKS